MISQENNHDIVMMMAISDDGIYAIIYLPLFDLGQRGLRFVRGDIIAEKFNIA